ncbi:MULTISPECIES: ABC-F family ATP-binding cassette domain-containing protein [Micrococcaceae]|uniref:ABC-F family ATP-binding cassette domain-containing protein n=1 Tax=Micrococcaceae TaxID=1268 RepID=UPI0016105B63|nr:MULTISPECIES: ABC-F family ATP-binding cassette domain-containing protein [Micrococcaceae]MBB5748099.1 ATPase subunit of ABC transporter with duplicated ATPase domains [Micrococcus sp. TA1]HRO30475.1 ABC-F family ATP-binding cassette domain-containing protein [Citricoccus sp.]HRO92570.1 ABC-F family ATP-binding cassette domain-containing protein [Citricoccus sp.]
MAHLLGAENIGISFGTRTVLDAVSLGVDEGDRIGLVGRNGDGKSTLMRILAGQQEPDAGRVTRRGGVTLGVLDQRDDLDDADTVKHAVVGDVPDHVWASDPKIRDVMQGLLGGLDWERTVGTLSGGQRRRTALARLLAGDDDLIFLDEPTNHLDVEGVAWLAGHLKTRWRATDGGLLVVTHDRWFLDEVCTRTWEVHDATVEPFDGGYAAWMLARAERDRAAAVMESKRQQLVKKELAWLRRGAPARTSKPKFRIEAANAVIADVPEPRDSVSLAKMATARLGKDVLDLESVTYTIPGPDGGAPVTLFDDVTLRLAPGERVGIVGVNGAGKSTLMRLLDGQVQPDSGRVRRGKTVQTAILTQDVRELDEVSHLRVAEVMAREGNSFQVGGRDLSTGQLLEQLGFGTSRQWTPVAELSGGERRRLQLLRLMVGEPNVLMLDEPTNDLDTDTLAAVEDMLDGWPGTLVVVSHDRYLLERVTDHQLALLGDGRVRDLPGGVDQYLALRREQESPGTGRVGGLTGAGGGAGAPPAGGGTGSSAPAGPGTAAVPSGPSEAEKRAARKEAGRLERQLARLAEEESELHARMARLSESGDFEALAGANADLQELAERKEQAELAWLEAGEVAEG